MLGVDGDAGRARRRDRLVAQRVAELILSQHEYGPVERWRAEAGHTCTDAGMTCSAPTPDHNVDRSRGRHRRRTSRCRCSRLHRTRVAGTPLVTTVAMTQPSRPVTLSSVPDMPLPSTEPVPSARVSWKPMRIPSDRGQPGVRRGTRSPAGWCCRRSDWLAVDWPARCPIEQVSMSVTRLDWLVSGSMPSPCAQIAAM